MTDKRPQTALMSFVFNRPGEHMKAKQLFTWICSGGCLLLLGACAARPPYVPPTSGPLAQVRYKVVEPIGGAFINAREGCSPFGQAGELRSIPVFYKGDRGGVVDPAFAERTLQVQAGTKHSFAIGMDLWGNGNLYCSVGGSFRPIENTTYHVDLTFSYEKSGCGARLFQVLSDGTRQAQAFESAPVCERAK